MILASHHRQTVIEERALFDVFDRQRIAQGADEKIDSTASQFPDQLIIGPVQDLQLDPRPVLSEGGHHRWQDIST